VYWKNIPGYEERADWKNIPGYEERADCKKCGGLETKNPRWFKCQAHGQSEVWEAAETLWNKTTEIKDRKNKWIDPSEALIRGLKAVKKVERFSTTQTL
jgi:hypothetical protein